MKYLQSFIAALLIVCAGCATTESTAYKAIGTVAHTVDIAMLTYGDFYRAGMVDEQEAEAVRNAYEHYQRAMRIARVSVAAAKSAPDGQLRLETALQAVEASSAELVVLIHFIK